MVNQVSKVNFIRLNAVPEGWLPDSIYFIKNYTLTDPIADLYITDMSGNPLRVGNINLTQEQITTFFHDKRVFKIFDNIAQRDQYIQSNPDYAQLFLVIDASDDPNVSSNSAFYGYRPAFTGHSAEVFFISDFESQNISLSWGNIENRPSSTVQAIDLAVANYQNIYNNLASLTEDVEDVQTLAQVNQLNITEKADQFDFDNLQTVVTEQGITLAQKADQTALDSLATVVSGKATPADITSAIAALVDGAPDALNTLSEIATALAGEQAQISDLLAALALRVRVDAVQSLSIAQQLQARQNINAEQVGVAANLVANITPASIGAATAVQGAKADTALQSADLAPVAFSGAYSALTGLPTIPGLSISTPAAPTTGGTAGTATTAARGDHAHPLPTSEQITAAVLTGLASGSATAIAAVDTLLAALAKLQAQATANAGAISVNSGLLAPAERKIGASWYVSGGWYDAEYPRYVEVNSAYVTRGQTFFIPRQILETATFTSLAFYCSIGLAGAKAYAGIYSDNAGQPGSLLASFSADCSTNGVKSGAISLTLSAGQIVWDAFLLTGTAAQIYRYNVTRALQEQTGADENTRTYRLKTGQTDLAATATGTSTAQADSVPRLMLQRA